MVTKTGRSEESTRERILLAAEAHFAENGLENASVRAIMRAAQANSALLAYYFGSKEALYKEVVERAASRIVVPRMKALDKLRSKSGAQPIPVRDLVRALCEAPFDRIGKRNTPTATYLRFFGRLYSEPNDPLRGAIGEAFRSMQRSYLHELARSLPVLSQEDLVWRFSYMIGALIFIAGDTNAPEELSEGLCDPRDKKTVVDSFVHSMSAMLNAPPLTR